LQDLQLTEDEDQITWRFNANGNYSVQSAYQTQFIGSQYNEKWRQIWNAKVENKCKFFIWQLLQYKLPTSEKFIAR
ncbi:hypothetical protein BAE44_0019335, partial [Dichanthelium oligosanthes]